MYEIGKVMIPKNKKVNLLLRYSLVDLVYLCRCYVYTKLFFKNSRLIRLPIDIRGKRQIQIGNNFTTGKYCRIEVINTATSSSKADKLKIIIGDNVQMNDNVHLAATNSVVIGNNVLIASKVFITDHNHGNYNINTDKQDSPLIAPIDRPLYFKDVIIEDNVWIGEFVSVLSGVTIGKGSIIGTMSVVTQNIPPFSIAVGSPAKVIKKYNFNTEAWEKVAR